MLDSTLSAPNSEKFSNPFLAPTIEAAAYKIQHHSDLEEKLAARRASDIRAFQKYAGLSPTELFTPKLVRNTIKTTNHKKAGISAGRWRNICASVRWALGCLGFNQQYLPTHSGPLAPEWQRLYDLTKPQLKYSAALSRPIRFLSANKVKPADVTEKHFSQYHEALLDGGHKNPGERHHTARKYWNKARLAFEGWPDIEIGIPECSDLYSYPLLAFTKLQPEIEAYISFRHEAENGPGSRLLRPPTKKKGAVLTKGAAGRVRYYVRQLASCLAHQGRAPETIQLADLTDPTTLERALEFLADRVRTRWIAENPGREPSPDDIWRNAQINILVCTVIQIARRYGPMDTSKLELLKNLRLNTAPMGSAGEHIIKALQVFMNDKNVGLFYQEPDRIVSEAHSSGAPTVVLARTIMYATWWRLETRFPLRISNALDLRLGKDIIWDGPLATATFQLHLKATAKGGMPIHEPIPESVSKILRLWVTLYRPLLCKGSSDFLFPGWHPDAPRDASKFSETLQTFMKDRIGFAINPHSFRHLATYMYLKSHTGDYHGASTLLGHTNVQTTIEYYDVLSKLEVFKRFDQFLLNIEAA